MHKSIATAGLELESYTAVVVDLESQLRATVLYTYGYRDSDRDICINRLLRPRLSLSRTAFGC